jgi:hypothetical protein
MSKPNVTDMTVKAKDCQKLTTVVCHTLDKANAIKITYKKMYITRTRSLHCRPVVSNIVDFVQIGVATARRPTAIQRANWMFKVI